MPYIMPVMGDEPMGICDECDQPAIWFNGETMLCDDCYRESLGELDDDEPILNEMGI